MNLPLGAVLSYSYEPEAWYWPAVLSGKPEQVPDVLVAARVPGDGCHWGLLIEDDGSGEVRLNRYCDPEDLDAARAQVPEFFAAMAEVRPRTLEDVRAILVRLGAEDVTMRERS